MKQAATALGGLGARTRVGVACVSLLIAGVVAAPAGAQAVTVIGDPGGAACYRAAAFEPASRSGLDACDNAIDSGALLRRDLAATHLNRGIIRTERGDVDGALADYLEARRIRPNMPESYVGEGNVRFLHGDFSAALNAYDTALENGLSARHAGYFNRGLVLEHMGRWDDAEAAYAEAAALAPDWRLPGEHIERVRQRRAAAAAQSQ